MKKKKVEKVTRARKTRTPKKVVDKPFADSTMTNTAFFGFIRSALRQKSRYWYPITVCKLRAREKYGGPNKRRKWLYRCEECRQLFDIKEVAAHHIIECGSLRSFEDLAGFIQRLFCNSDGLRLLCNKCHVKQHKKEKEEDDTGNIESSN
jgi:hypothetical protein